MTLSTPTETANHNDEKKSPQKNPEIFSLTYDTRQQVFCVMAGESVDHQQLQDVFSIFSSFDKAKKAIIYFNKLGLNITEQQIQNLQKVAKSFFQLKSQLSPSEEDSQNSSKNFRQFIFRGPKEVPDLVQKISMAVDVQDIKIAALATVLKKSMNDQASNLVIVRKSLKKAGKTSEFDKLNTGIRRLKAEFNKYYTEMKACLERHDYDGMKRLAKKIKKHEPKINDTVQHFKEYIPKNAGVRKLGHVRHETTKTFTSDDLSILAQSIKKYAEGKLKADDDSEAFIKAKKHINQLSEDISTVKRAYALLSEKERIFLVNILLDNFKKNSSKNSLPKKIAEEIVDKSMMEVVRFVHRGRNPSEIQEDLLAENMDKQTSPFIIDAKELSFLGSSLPDSQKELAGKKLGKPYKILQQLKAYEFDTQTQRNLSSQIELINRLYHRYQVNREQNDQALVLENIIDKLTDSSKKLIKEAYFRLAVAESIHKINDELSSTLQQFDNQSRSGFSSLVDAFAATYHSLHLYANSFSLENKNIRMQSVNMRIRSELLSFYDSIKTSDKSFWKKQNILKAVLKVIKGIDSKWESELEKIKDYDNIEDHLDILSNGLQRKENDRIKHQGKKKNYGMPGLSNGASKLLAKLREDLGLDQKEQLVSRKSFKYITDDVWKKLLKKKNIFNLLQKIREIPFTDKEVFLREFHTRATKFLRSHTKITLDKPETLQKKGYIFQKEEYINNAIYTIKVWDASKVDYLFTFKDKKISIWKKNK